jgi:hypothetical protein
MLSPLRGFAGAACLRALPRRRVGAALGLLLGLATPAATRAGEPFALFDGRLRFGGEVSGTLAPEDEGYFNYSDYERSSLRLFRVDLAAELRLGSKAALLGEIRSDNLSSPRVYALYLRLRPWSDRAFDVQAGLVPPVFGAYPRRRYGYDSWLPGVPLAYQYLTTVRYDAVPANAEELVAQRGRGWLVSYPVGDPQPAPGLPLVNGERWDAGAEVRIGDEPLSLSLAVTQGTLSHPTVRDDNDGKQVSGRLAWRPGPALTLGISGATGSFLSRDVTDVLPPGSGADFAQQALGVDLELARGYWILRGEGVWTRWKLPPLEETRIEAPVGAFGAYAEVRYKLKPGLYLAGRVEHLGFAEVASELGVQTWDADVTRIEAGAGYSPVRPLVLKASWQHNWRDGGRVRENDLVAVQVLLWF